MVGNGFFRAHAQVRRAIQQMMFPNKTFYWPRHIAIAFVLLTFINLLVIFAPNILGIFGVIGRFSLLWDINTFPCILILDLPKVDLAHPHVTLYIEHRTLVTQLIREKCGGKDDLTVLWLDLANACPPTVSQRRSKAWSLDHVQTWTRWEQTASPASDS